MMVITKHAKIRGLQRLIGRTEEWFDDKALASIEFLLINSIKPSFAPFVDGTKYHAMIDGFDRYRAVIQVDGGVHYVKTITPTF